MISIKKVLYFIQIAVIINLFHQLEPVLDIVSVEQNVASTFKLTKYNQVIVTKIDPEVLYEYIIYLLSK